MTMWAPRIEGRKAPLFAAIADALGEDVSRGRLREGDRLPTHRELADRLGVTVGTVTRAYAEAARRGLVTGEVGRGTFVRGRAPEMLPVHSARPASIGAIDLSVNVPASAAALPAEAAGAALLALRGSGLDPLLGYPPEGGFPRHREAGAAWITAAGLPCAPGDVVVVSGSQHALTTLFTTVVRPGDLVLCEALTYPGFKAVAGLLHLRLQGIALDEHGLRPDALEAACRTAAPRALYCVPTIQNPTTAVMSASRREEIARIARRYGVAVIEDDIHRLLAPGAPPPIARFAPEITHYVLSTSKSLAPGLRVAFVRAAPGSASRLAAATRATTWGAAPLMAEIAARWIVDGTADAITAARRAEAAARQSIAAEALGPALRAHPSGYHAWLSLPDPWRAATFAERARARGVLVTAADAFAVGRVDVPHAVRVSLGAPATREELETGLRAIGEVLEGSAEAAPPIV